MVYFIPDIGQPCYAIFPWRCLHYRSGVYRTLSRRLCTLHFLHLRVAALSMLWCARTPVGTGCLLISRLHPGDTLGGWHTTYPGDRLCGCFGIHLFLSPKWYTAGTPIEERPVTSRNKRSYLHIVSICSGKYIAFSIGWTCRFDRSEVPNALILSALISGNPLYSGGVVYNAPGDKHGQIRCTNRRTAAGYLLQNISGDGAFTSRRTQLLSVTNNTLTDSFDG